MYAIVLCTKSIADVVLPLRPGQPDLGAGLLTADQCIGGIGQPHCHGERTCDQTNLIITSFDEAPAPQRHRHNQINRPMQGKKKIRQLLGERLAQTDIPAIFQPMQSVPNRAFEDRPGSQRTVVRTLETTICTNNSVPVQGDAANVTDWFSGMSNTGGAAGTPAAARATAASALGREQQIKPAPQGMVEQPGRSCRWGLRQFSPREGRAPRVRRDCRKIWTAGCRPGAGG